MFSMYGALLMQVNCHCAQRKCSGV